MSQAFPDALTPLEALQLIIDAGQAEQIERNAEIVASGEPEPDEEDQLDDLAEILEEGAGSNVGSRASHRRPGNSISQDGQSWPGAYSSMDTRYQAAIQYVQQNLDGVTVAHRGDLHWHGAHGYKDRWQIVQPYEYLDEEHLRAVVLDLLDVTEHDLELLSRGGIPDPKVRADRDQAQVRLDEKLLQIKESGGRVLELARILKWPLRRVNNGHGEDCVRLRKALSRARKRREAASG